MKNIDITLPVVKKGEYLGSDDLAYPFSFKLYGEEAAVVGFEMSDAEDGSEYETEYSIPGYISFEGKSYPVTEIASDAFSFKDLGKLILPSTMQNICSEAFDWSGICEIVLPDSEITIFPSAFSNSGLKRINLYGSLQVIDDHVFDNCGSLEAIEVPEGIKLIGNNAFYRAFNHIEKLVLPNSLEAIENSAFFDAFVSEVVLPNSLKFIDHCAFAGSEITRITIPNSVEQMGHNLFNCCEHLKEVWLQWEELPKGMEFPESAMIYVGADKRRVK